MVTWSSRNFSSGVVVFRDCGILSASETVYARVRFFPANEDAEEGKRVCVIFSRCSPLRLIQDAKKQGLRVYDRCEVSKVESSGGGVVLHTASGFRINGQRVVFATGYESQQYLKQNVGALKSTFALISEPCDSFEGWPDRSLIWESARPYFYLRTTSDERAIISGEDVPYATAHKSEQLIARKTQKLQRRFADMFPRLDLEVSTHGQAPSARLKMAWRTSARLQNFRMPILRSATAAMASRLASLRLRSSPTFILVDLIRTPISSGSIDERWGHGRVGR